MAQWLIGPFWEGEHRRRHDDADRLYQVDYKVTEIRITNPTDEEGRIDLLFYEARADGNYHAAEWASGPWTVPPKYVRYYRPDPSRIYGDSFYTHGWFELWLSKDEMVVDASISGTSRSMVSGGTEPGAGGVIESISQRTLHLTGKRIPLILKVPEWFGRDPVSPIPFPPGTPPVKDQPGPGSPIGP